MQRLLVPAGTAAADAAQAVRQRVFVLAGALLMGPNLLYHALAFAVADEPANALIDGSGALVVLGSAALVLWRPATTAWVCRFNQAAMLLLLLTAMQKGAGSLVLYWPLVIPVLAVFLFGRWEGLGWALLALAGSLPVVLDATAHGAAWVAANWPDWVTAYAMVTACAVGYDWINALAARAATRERARLADFAATSSDWFFELDADLRVVSVQGDWPGLDGRAATELPGQPLVTRAWHLDGDGRSTLEDLLGSKALRHVQVHAPDVEGTPRVLLLSSRLLHDADGQLRGVRGSGTDVTAQVRVEQDLRNKEAALHQADRLSTLGQLTSGIAHDFNNVMTVVRGHLDMLHEHLAPGREASDLLDQAAAAARSASELNARLLDVARRPSDSNETLDVAEVLDEVRLLMQRSLGAQVLLAVETPPDLWALDAQRSHLQSALFNLLLNARDAMPDGGRIVLRAANLHCPLTDLPTSAREQLTAPVPADRAHWLRLEVEDTGNGIPAAAVERIFEPFYTTKAAGRGTGLGLAMVRGFVTQAGGWLETESREGVGTCMRLVLPALAPDADAGTASTWAERNSA